MEPAASSLDQLLLLPPNVARIVASIGRLAYWSDKRSTSVLLFGSNQLKRAFDDGTQLQITQVSDYPNSGHVRLSIDEAPQTEYTIRLRVPAWAENATLSVYTPNSGTVADKGQLVSRQDVPAGKFAEARRRWSKGESIELHFDVPTQWIEAHPLVEECRGQLALQRGPIVYCVESTDLPPQTSLLSTRLANDSPRPDYQLNTQYPKLEGLPILDGELLVPTETGSKGDQQKSNDQSSLYRPYRSTSMRKIKAAFIPYFAWGNRGPSEMSVWMPAQP